MPEPYNPDKPDLHYLWDMVPHYGSPAAIYQHYIDGQLTGNEMKKVAPDAASQWYLATQLKALADVLKLHI